MIIPIFEVIFLFVDVEVTKYHIYNVRISLRSN